MWTVQLHPLGRQTIKATLSDSTGLLSFRHVIELWRDSESFRSFFTATLSQIPFEAFFWETPPVTRRTVDRVFECVVIESGALARLNPDTDPFSSQFTSRPFEPVLTFPNLGGDAILVVPAPLAHAAGYTHLARFLRQGPRGQVDALWRSVGVAMHDRLSDAPTWLSTAGMGVSWLHIRLDARPKYYRHGPYKTSP